MRPRTVRRLAASVLAGALAGAALVIHADQAHAQPLDPYMPLPPVWCPGGGIMTGWGGYCDGKTFLDGTKWHMDAVSAPFVGMVWNPIVCVVDTGEIMQPQAPPGGCNGGWEGPQP